MLISGNNNQSWAAVHPGQQTLTSGKCCVAILREQDLLEAPRLHLAHERFVQPRKLYLIP